MARPKKPIEAPTALAPDATASAPATMDLKMELKDACIVAAHAVIAEHGIEKLSLRDVARKLKVSHQAPYRHYPSRDHLLAEVIRRCFRRFTDALNGRQRNADPIQDMRALGASYLGFALHHPLEYRLMFGTPWPQVADNPELVTDSQHSFNVLREALAPLYSQRGLTKDELDSHAMFVWSSMHGLATILQSQTMQHLNLSEAVMNGVTEHIMKMVDAALVATAVLPKAS